MNKMNFVLFFTIFFTLYGLINFYVFLRGWQAIPPDSTLRIPYAVIFWALALSFIAGRFLERIAISTLSDIVVWVGSFWLAAFAYFMLIALFIDLLRLLNYIVPFFPSFITRNYARAKEMTALGAVLLVTGAIAVGYFNARSPRLRTLRIHINKNVDSLRKLNLAVASDIHLGTIIGRSRLDAIVETINTLEPDLILLPGDIVDEDLGPVIKQNLGETLRKLKAKYGVLAITGNHEYIGGVEEACGYLEEHGITVLRDTSVRVNSSLFVIGREDRSISQFAGKRRKPLEDLMMQVDKRFPVILMDHQPFGLDEAVRQGIDLQLSGHTHHGQIWPFQLITRAVYELSWGYLKRASTHIYVSSGVGTWGPPVRLGNTPEIVNIQLTFGREGSP